MSVRRAVALALGTLLWPFAGREAGSLQASDTTPLRLGVMAEEPTKPQTMLRVYGDLVALLRVRVAPDVRVEDLVIARDVEDLAARLRAEQVDFVIETVFPTILLNRRSHALEPTLVVVRRGLREYRAVFFTRKEEPIRTLADLRGRLLVLQALRSTSAFALPRAELLAAGLKVAPADDSRAGRDAVRYALAGAEINQAVWVANGRGDAGAFNESDWQALPAGVRDRLRVFHRTRPILRGLLSFRSGFDSRTRARLESLLLALHEDPEGRRVLRQASGITRLERLTSADRLGLRAWERTLGPIEPGP